MSELNERDHRHRAWRRAALVVLALVATGFFAVPRFCAWYFTSHRGICHKCVVDLSAIDRALRAHARDHAGEHPDTLEALMESERPYLDRDTVPLDPWGRPYRMEAGAPGKPPRVFTLGGDNEPGGTGADKDSDNRQLPESGY